MKTLVPESADKRLTHSFSSDAAFQMESIDSRWRAGVAAAHKCMDPGRYLILMRQRHGRAGLRRFPRFPTPAGS
jgi:hypothetical protein